ncbi:hypothetical protein Hamer_G005798 [Homarus americanus]|uniref:Uncharacterized protein n=1 Tax=Homarus americanus TaxID=6706 RepID=A0A8J5JKX9_HOMAM|nr:hypothetical protein Hamer_G005798 [Homarus americanus]
MIDVWYSDVWLYGTVMYGISDVWLYGMYSDVWLYGQKPTNKTHNSTATQVMTILTSQEDLASGFL